jgi:hypothetical protein
MRRLHVDLEELASAFEDSSYELNFYLDLETGKVELVTEDTRRELEAFDKLEKDEEFSAEEQQPASERGIPEWQHDALTVARAVEESYGTRHVAVPKVESHEAYRDMEDFIATVRNPLLQERLYRAISGRGAFRYFKDALLDYPKEREHWFAYRDEHTRQRMLEWLRAEEIEPIE